MKQSTRVLNETRSLLARPYGWTKGQFRRFNTRAPDGVSYCLTGAVSEACRLLNEREQWSRQSWKRTRTQVMRLLRQELRNTVGHDAIEAFNDAKSTRKANVLMLIDKALAEST